MGIRPQFRIVVGIDDVIENDPRWVHKVDDVVIQEDPPVYYPGSADVANDDWSDEAEEIRKDMYGCEFSVLDEVLYNVLRPIEYRCKNVVGLVIHDGDYDSQIYRALAAIDEKFESAGVMRIPNEDPKAHRLAYRQYGYTDEDVRCNRYVYSVFENSPGISRMYWRRARFYLLQAGWDIPETELRYLLVWDWS
jgi:hypothetical protein